MADAKWPKAGERSLIGKRISRLDGPEKVTGSAQYAYDVNLPGLLYAKLVTSAHAKGKIIAIDLSDAESSSGVKAVWKDEGMVGGEIRYVGQVLGAVAAETEEQATEAALKVNVDYEVQQPQVVDSDSQFATGRESKRESGDIEAGLKEADVVAEGKYGLPVITHCCLEPHGQTAEVRDGELYIWPSTQNVSRYADGMDDAVGIPRSKTHVDCQYMGGGFGSKFGSDKWGTLCSQLAKETGRPVKLLLDRNIELMIAGNRPSAYGEFKVGIKNDGTITAFQANVWGTGGVGGYGMRWLPYIYEKIRHTLVTTRGIRTNRGGQRAWRAPAHPQCALLTMSALEDAAAKIKMDALEFFRHNIQLTDKPDVYLEELEIAADLIGYKEKSHLRGEGTPGSVKRGLGISLHRWGGLGHPSECDLSINPDGSVTAEIGTQDLGTGARTVIAIVVGETLGLPIEAITVRIGRNSYPASGASGGSTTVGGTSTASRLASTSALNELLKIVAPHLGVSADALEAKQGVIREINQPTNAIQWTDACSLLGTNTLVKRGVNDRNESRAKGFIDSNVGGVQIADVSVDTETGIVTMNQMVAVQDCGLIIDMKTAESQVFGALIMGITSALYEEALYDAETGVMLNADMEFYRLAGIKDIGNLKVHMMTGKKYEDRGVIGLGEPPVISPAAAISNAVANACGVRVPYLPLTPDRVLDALEKGGIA